ncbi:MAG: V-type ATP synthase subunit I [Clostridia bacterium]|nr:V-type ATP synthase subunit I [Clostridia bacterium]
MAKIKMKYLEIAAPVEESKDIFDYLQLSNSMELEKLEETEGLQIISTEKTVSSIEKYSEVAGKALQALDRYAPEKSSLISALKPLPEMTFSEFVKKSDSADEILGVCYDICECEKNITDSKAAIARNEAAIDAVKPWLPLDVPMKFKGTETTDAYIGTLPDLYSAESLTQALSDKLADEGRFECEVVSQAENRSCIFVLCSKECSEEVLAALRSMGFSYPSDPTKHPPRVRYERLAAENKKLKETIEESKKEIAAHASDREDIQFVSDYFSIRRERYKALNNVSTGDRIVIISGYVPENKAEKLTSELDSRFSVAMTLTEPDESKDAPVYLKNSSVAAAVEPITEMYSAPGKDDLDPNPIMAAFYYIFFGLMLSDAGYGLLMAIGCGIAKFKFKVQGKMKKTVDMYFWCGLATLFWGTLFGSWFGDIFELVANQFFGIPDLGAHLNSLLGFNLFKDGIALWFQPVNDPMKLMIYSFLFGIIHLFVGLGACFVKMWKQGNKTGAVFDVIPVYIFVLGIASIGAGVLMEVPPAIKEAGKWCAIAGAVLIILTAGRDSKNIVGKLGLGLYGLYNTASGWLSDILSYSRLLALGLCTGVIASVVNTLGTMPQNLALKAIMLVPVFIFGHTVNMAINLIGTYVHTNRLQYVEFFSKFYEGGGRTFTPLGNNTKYIHIKEDK